MMDAAARHGVRAVAEVFADRSYEDDGTLTPRDQPGAMITDEHASVAQVLQMVERGTVRSRSGIQVPVAAGTPCLHGDQRGAAAYARNSTWTSGRRSRARTCSRSPVSRRRGARATASCTSG